MRDVACNSSLRTNLVLYLLKQPSHQQLVTNQMRDLYHLVSRNAVSPDNNTVVSSRYYNLPLDANERRELLQLQCTRFPDLVVPSEDVPVSKFRTCHVYNVRYHGTETAPATRDCFIGCDYYYGRSSRPRRVYGEVRFFVQLAIKDSMLQFTVAYVEWFQHEPGEPMHVYQRHHPPAEPHFRAIPLTDIQCKIALLPVGGRAPLTKRSVLHLP